MKAVSFIVSLCCFLVFLLGSTFFVHTQIGAIRGLELSVLENRLYQENTEILSWAMKTFDPAKLAETPLPASWGEILILDNSSLVIRTSSNPDHVGKGIHAIPQLLDESSAIIQALKKPGRTTLQTRSYMIAISPLSKNETIVGFKPRAFEQGLVSAQTEQVKKSTDSLRRILIWYLIAGVILAVVFPLVIVSVSFIPLKRASKAFERLSLGDFDAEMDGSGKSMKPLKDSFFRLKTSLKIALEKLGSR
ncbi:MAG: hypothetical protein WAR22_14145 [Desulfomonilia bacterium]|jgi:methyl-accepting chemotaxis protein